MYGLISFKSNTGDKPRGIYPNDYIPWYLFN